MTEPENLPAVDLGPDDFEPEIRNGRVVSLQLTAGAMTKLAAAGYTKQQPINLSVQPAGDRFTVTVTAVRDE